MWLENIWKPQISKIFGTYSVKAEKSLLHLRSSGSRLLHSKRALLFKHYFFFFFRKFPIMNVSVRPFLYRLEDPLSFCWCSFFGYYLPRFLKMFHWSLSWLCFPLWVGYKLYKITVLVVFIMFYLVTFNRHWLKSLCFLF